MNKQSSNQDLKLIEKQEKQTKYKLIDKRKRETNKQTNKVVIKI